MNATEREVFSDRKALINAIERDKAPKGIMTALKQDNGKYFILSRYEDPVWRLPSHWFPAGTHDAHMRIKFELITSHALREQAKLVMFSQFLTDEVAGNMKRGASIFQYYYHIASWMNWLAKIGIECSSRVTPMVAQQYIEYIKSLKGKGKRKNEPLSEQTIAIRLLAVEKCWEALKNTKYAFPHPWPESSASALSSLGSLPKQPKTEIIPDEILAPITQYAEMQLRKSDELLGHRDALESMSLTASSVDGKQRQKIRLLKSRGWDDGLSQLNQSLVILRDCCLLLILLTTGMRSHEVRGIKRDEWYSEIKDGERFYFIGSRSDKTYEGSTHWLCPRIAIDAVKVLERLAEPLQNKLEQALKEAVSRSDMEEINRLSTSNGAVCILTSQTQNNRINVMTSTAIIKRLQKLIDKLELVWELRPHQFRRTFANFVVHHKLGDLRYLRDHFKHWSLDMSALYALNEGQDLELYDEIYSAFDEERQGIIGHWLEPDTPVSGGLAENVRRLRGNDEVRVYKNRNEMVKEISDQIHLRATGLAWCTNDDGTCGGACEECEHGLIDDKQKMKWEAIYVQQLELRQIDDLGESGSKTVESAIKRCEKVLRDLGADMSEIQQKVANNV